MNFTDRENSEKVICDLVELKTSAEIQKYIEKIFPGWLLYSFNKYCSDYPHLQKNWETICKLSNVSPQKIVIVSEIQFDDQHRTIRAFCEFMTNKGYVVRRDGEFIPCTVCSSAIPPRDMWELMKAKKLPVPKVWNKKCSECQ